MNLPTSITFWGFLVCLCPFALAQPFSSEDYLKGYAHRNDTTYFLFDKKHYGNPETESVVVTGSFRGWSQDMDVPEWHLTPRLAVYNPAFSIILPHTSFKFRINQGEWLTPPATAPNQQGGNLIFMQEITLPVFKAEMRRSGTIWCTAEGFERPFSPKHIAS